MGCNSSSFIVDEEDINVNSEVCTDMLEPAHCFSFASILQELKATPSLQINGQEYGLLHTGGFVRIATDVCRVYYMAQNTTEHTTPDWKFHVSVCPEDLPKAWDIIAKLFVESGCRSGMKMCFYSVDNNFGHWSEKQFGREITIYIYQYVKPYKAIVVDEPHLKLTRKLEHNQKFWEIFITEIERLLMLHRIKSNGLADGDRALNAFVRIRNEAYVKVNNELVYPPNENGYNAAGHKCPFKINF